MNFTGATAVDFGSTAGSYTVVSDLQIDATTPAGSAGTVDVTVTNPDGTSSTGTADQFTYYAPPTVTAVNPAIGLTSGGGSVTITGTGFTGATAVSFGSSSASFAVNSASQITATVPFTFSPGTVDVTVQTSAGTSASSSSDQYTYTQLLWSPAIANQTKAEGDSVSLSAAAGYSGLYTVAYSALNLPPGLSINASTGVISGTVSNGDARQSQGSYNTTVFATDAHGAVAQTSFSWTITPTVVTPTPTNPGNQSSAAGADVSLQLAASNPDNGQLTYEVAGIPKGLTINSSTGLISGTIDTLAASPTPYVVTFYASNGQSANSVSFDWTVNAADLTPTVASPGNQTNTAGDGVALPIAASDPSGNPLAYTASGLPYGLAIDSTTGVISGTISSGAAASSPYSVTVTVSDGSLHASQSFTWTVNYIGVSSPGAQANADGDAVALAIGTIDGTGGTLSFSASGLPSGLSIDSSTGIISGTITAGASASSPFTATVTASDGTHSSSTTFVWTVSDIALANPGNQADVEGATASLTLTASNADSETLTFGASGLPTGLSINSSTGVISGTVGLTDHGSSPYQVTVSLSNGTSTLHQSFVWTVSAAAALTNPGAQDGTAGTAASLQMEGASLNGSTISYSASGLPSGLSINASTGLISGTIGSSAAAGSPYTVTVTATAGSASTSQTFTWVVADLTLPSLGNQASLDGASISLSAAAGYGGSGTVSYAATGLPTGLSINSSTGLISGTIGSTADTGSPYSVAVTATVGSDTVTANFTWQVKPVVVLSPIQDQVSAGGDSGSLAVTASDANSSTLSYSVTGLPSGVSINSSTGLISGTIATSAASTTPYSVTVSATDGTYSASQTFNWTVEYIAVINPGPQTAVDGGTYSLTLSAENATIGTPSWSATGLPSGLSINSSTGVISGTLASNADTGSGYLVTATVSAAGHSDSQVFTFTVTTVGLQSPGNQSNVEGNTVSASLAGTAGTGTLTYSATGLPAGLSINSSTGAISGTVAAGAAALSPYQVAVVASNGTDASSQAFTWTIAGVVTLSAVADQSNAEGDTVSLTLSATDANSAALTYSATGLPSGLTINSATGVISGTVAAGDFAAGPQYVVQLTASDGTYSASQLLLWTIANPDESGTTLTNPGTQSNQAGDAVDLVLSGFVPNGETAYFSASGLPDGLFLNSYTGAIAGTLADDAVSPAPYSVTVSISDGMGNTAAQSFNWYVDASSLSASPSSLSATAGTFTGNVTLATFTTPDLNTQPSTFAATVDWGDGASGDASIEGSAGSYTVVGGHTYAAAGTYSVSIAITNPSGSTNGAILSLSASVADGTLIANGGFEIYAQQGQSITATIATFSDTNLLAPTSTFSATIDWGDGSSSGSGTVTPLAPGVFAVSGTHTYTGTGTETISITVNSSGGASASTTSTADVTSTAGAPPLSLMANNINFTPTTAFSGVLIGVLTDPNTSDTISNFSASIDWGDGSALDTSATITGGAGLFTVNAGHTYSGDQQYTFTINIIQNGAQAAAAAAVAQPPPGGGSLTGPAIVPGNSNYSYWINTPANAVAGSGQIQLLDGPSGAPIAPSIAQITWNGSWTTGGVVTQVGFSVNFYNTAPATVYLSYTVMIGAVQSAPYTLSVTLVQVNVGDGSFTVGDLAVHWGVFSSKILVGTYPNPPYYDQPALAWTASANLAAPAANPSAVDSVTVGFIQQATIAAWSLIYGDYSSVTATGDPVNTVTSSPSLGGAALIGQTFVDVGRGPSPWYNPPSTTGNIRALRGNDSPFAQYPFNITVGSTSFDLWQVSRVLQFRLDVAATVSSAGQGPFYWSEATANWSDNMSGSLANGVFYRSWSWAPNSGITGPGGGWGMITSPTAEIISTLTANGACDSATWNPPWN